jgi:hypothetical protein
VTKEAAQLRDSLAKLSQDFDGKSDHPLLFLFDSAFVPCRGLTCRLCLQGHV